MNIIKQALTLAIAWSLNCVWGMQQDLNKQLFDECSKKNHNLEIIKSLINKKADVNCKDNDGWTLLQLRSCYKTSIPTIKILFTSFIDKNINKNGMLICLCLIKKINKIIPKPIMLLIIKNLFKDDIKNYINEKNKHGKAALNYAQQFKNTEILIFLNKLLELLENGLLQDIIVLLN